MVSSATTRRHYETVTTVERDGYAVRAYDERSETLDGMLRQAVERAPRRTAVAFPERDVRYTYATFDERVDALADGLGTFGVEAGNVVALLVLNRSAFVTTVFACARVGAVVAPFNTRVSVRANSGTSSATQTLPVCWSRDGSATF